MMSTTTTTTATTMTAAPQNPLQQFDLFNRWMGGHDVFVNPDAILPHLSPSAASDADIGAATNSMINAAMEVAGVTVPQVQTPAKARSSTMSGK